MFNDNMCTGYEVDPVIQAIRWVEFEDGPRIGNQPESQNSLHRSGAYLQSLLPLILDGRMDQVSLGTDKFPTL